jgi:hypothetical protein
MLRQFKVPAFSHFAGFLKKKPGRHFEKPACRQKSD